jgi:hypothetical protein
MSQVELIKEKVLVGHTYSGPCVIANGKYDLILRYLAPRCGITKRLLLVHTDLKGLDDKIK